MTRSLVIAPQWIGDAVMSEPLLARLAERGERLTVAALRWVAPVYRAVAGVADVVELPFAHGRLDWGARRRAATALRGRFDAAYVLPNSFKAALLPFLARIPRRVGYVGEGRVFLLNERLPNPAGKPPMVAFYSALGGLADAVDRAPRLQIDASARRAVRELLGLDRQGYFVFAPGAEYGPAKRWPAAHFATLATRLHARHRSPILLIGSAGERELCDGIARAAPGCRVLAGSTSLDEAMALIADARGVVSNDSGLMHVAAAFGVPQVALFGSTSPAHTPPLNANAEVIWMKDALGLDCAPCFDRVCRYGHTRCLVELPPSLADRALQSALGRAAAAAQRL